MKKFITLLMLLSIVTVTQAQQVQKTLLRTFPLQGNNSVIIDVEGDVIIQEWENDDMLRVQMQITYNNGSVGLMKHLIVEGRYNIHMKSSPEGLMVIMPNKKESVIVSKEGDTLEENITYTIYIPKYLQVEILNTISTFAAPSSIDFK